MPMLSTENITEIRAASLVLLHLGSSKPEESAIGRRFLPLLTNPVHRDLAQHGVYPTALRLDLTDKSAPLPMYQQRKANLEGMIRSSLIVNGSVTACPSARLNFRQKTA